MKRNIFLGICALLLSGTAHGQDTTVEPQPFIKPNTYINPISALTMWADPTSVEYEGRLYVYGTNDQQQWDSNGGSANNNYGNIKTLCVMSTADMYNWTDHGTIDMKGICGSWMATSWAPSIVSRVEDDGLTHFYMYFSNSGGGVGVVTATHPLGPWTSPLNRSLISGATPGLGPCSCPFDPGVVIDDEGTGWLVFGGGDPVAGATKLQPGNARIVRLGDDMISLASDIIPIPAPYHFEANELNMIGGKMVYSYCTGWSDRNDWSLYGSSEPAPSTCSICYMIVDDPLCPETWTYGGDILKDPGQFGYPWGNNHSHLHKFCDKYYMLYHTQVMENLAGKGGGYRSVAVNEVQVDEATAHISPITATNNGPTQIKDNKLNAMERQQAETMWNASGVSVVSEKTQGNTSISKIKPGGWVAVRNPSFDGKTATRFTARIRGTGRMEIYKAKMNTTPIGVLDFSNGSMKEVTITIDKPIDKASAIFFLFTEASSNTRFDEWQFLEEDTEGIASAVVDDRVVSEEYYDMCGIRVASPKTGCYILMQKHSDGSITSKKVYLK